MPATTSRKGGALTALFEGPSLDTETGSGTETDAGTETTSPDGPESAVTTEAPEVPSIGASGTAVFTAGELNIEGDVVQCTLAPPDVDMVVNGENAGIEVYSIGGGEVGVVVSGMAEWEGRGQATIDGGDVSIVGDGSPQGAGTASEPFTIEARIESC